ncbi:MAG: tetratricopeptide repeat protein [Candidatus Obscuribacterales bacterium]|nr:tetratricopeptide repeat protein [Candidatus Obscuribacterales bacterium]
MTSVTVLAGCGPGAQQHQETGRQHLRNGDFRKAINVLSESIEENDKNPEARFLRAMGYLSLGESNKAFADLERVEALGGESDRGLLSRAWKLHLATGSDADARDLVKACKSLDGWKAYSLSTMLSDEEALESAQQATREAPGEATFEGRLGALYQRTKKFDDARACYEKVLEQNPHSAVFLSYLGFLFLEQGKLDSARPYLSKCLKEDPLFLGGRVTLDKLEELQHNDEKRLRLWTRVPGALEDNPLFFLRRGAMYLSVGKPKKAQADLTKFLSAAKAQQFTKTEMVVALRARARANYRDGKYAEASKDLEAGMAIAPEHLELVEFYPTCLAAAGKVAEADAFINNLLKQKKLSNSQRAQYLYVQANVFHTTDRFPQALESMSEAIKLNPGVADYYSFRGYTLSARGRFDEALRDFLKAKELGFDAMPLEISTIECYHATQKYKEGLAAVDALLKKHPDNPVCHLKRAQLLLRLNRVREGASEIDIACASPDLSVGECETVGHLLGSIGQRARAAEFFVLACIRDVANPKVRSKVNSLCTVIGTDNMIAAAVSGTVSEDESEPQLVFIRALCRLAGHETQEAMKDFDSAIKLAPDNGLFYTERGNCHLDSGNLTEAFEDFNTAIEKLGFKSASAYRGRGITNMHTRKIEEAIADFTSAIEKGPTQADAPYYERGMCYRTRGDNKKATTDMESALKYQFFQRKAVARRLAELYTQSCALDKAMNCYEIALKASATDVPALEGKAFVLKKLGKKQEAIDVYGSLIGHNPNVTGYYYKRADLYREIGQPDLAEADLRNARNIDRYMLGPDKKKYK